MTDDGASTLAETDGDTAPDAPASVGLGARMGRYVLRRIVGSGGMGVVFEARDPELDRPVAVKILHERRDGAAAEARLRDEGRIMARLTHPNVLRIYDTGVAHGRTFVAMEFVGGGTLADWLTRARRAPAEIAAVFVQAGRGLAAAHDAGLVHRDFKPSNVLVDDDGRVLVTDFGIARAAGDTREVEGTPAFMAPEQRRGAVVDPRADQFSFCVALWEALFGAPPLRDAATTAPRDEVATHVRLALECGLADDPDARFASMHELLAALSAMPVGAAPAPPPTPVQHTHVCRATDGTRLAYAQTGEGPPIVKTANWLSHLELDWDGELWTHWLGLLGRGRCLTRYDARGNGLSDWDPPAITFETFVFDLAAVFDAAGVGRAPVVGLSQGAAIACAYAARHPERVSGLILIGGCARGWRVKNHPNLTRQFEALMTLMEEGWGGRSPLFRQIFTTAFFPDASPALAAWWNDLQRKTTSPQNAAAMLSALGDVDVRAELPRIRVPTLVLHSRNDAVVPMSDGVELATGIAGARFVPLDSANHLILPTEPAWLRFSLEIRRFLAQERLTDGGSR